MLEQVSGFQSIKPLNYDEYKRINKLDAFSIQGDFQGDENSIGIENQLTNIDFSKINNSNDPELKADLQGLIEKNQEFDNNNQSIKPEITTGEVANKFSDVLGN